MIMNGLGCKLHYFGCCCCCCLRICCLALETKRSEEEHINKQATTCRRPFDVDMTLADLDPPSPPCPDDPSHRPLCIIPIILTILHHSPPFLPFSIKQNKNEIVLKKKTRTKCYHKVRFSHNVVPAPVSNTQGKELKK